MNVSVVTVQERCLHRGGYGRWRHRYWRSDAYLRYVRSRRDGLLQLLHGIAGAETDDFESDFVDIDEHDFDESDEA